MRMRVRGASNNRALREWDIDRRERGGERGGRDCAVRRAATSQVLSFNRAEVEALEAELAAAVGEVDVLRNEEE